MPRPSISSRFYFFPLWVRVRNRPRHNLTSDLPNGKRAFTHIAEVRGLEGEVPVLQDLF
jgi:hypothetical protein